MSSQCAFDWESVQYLIFLTKTWPLSVSLDLDQPNACSCPSRTPPLWKPLAKGPDWEGSRKQGMQHSRLTQWRGHQQGAGVKMSSNFGESYPFYCYWKCRPHWTGHKGPQMKSYKIIISLIWQGYNIQSSENCITSWVPRFFKHWSRHWTPCILNMIKMWNTRTSTSLGQEASVLGVWQRHAGLKDWRLAAAPFTIQLLSKLPCQLWKE